MVTGVLFLVPVSSTTKPRLPLPSVSHPSIHLSYTRIQVYSVAKLTILVWHSSSRRSSNDDHNPPWRLVLSRANNRFPDGPSSYWYYCELLLPIEYVQVLAADRDRLGCSDLVYSSIPLAERRALLFSPSEGGRYLPSYIFRSRLLPTSSSVRPQYPPFSLTNNHTKPYLHFVTHVA